MTTYSEARDAYHARNAAWEASPEGQAHREKHRMRDAENARWWAAYWARNPNPIPVEERIGAACASWSNVPKEEE